ncbi:MAG: ubiquinol-cytochrome c reductase iron-sulfur subunit [Fuerstiella sp.]
MQRFSIPLASPDKQLQNPSPERKIGRRQGGQFVILSIAPTRRFVSIGCASLPPNSEFWFVTLLTYWWKLEMSGQKLSTEEILAQIRGGASAPDTQPAVEETSAPEPTAAPVAEEVESAEPATPKPAPTGTADILASIKGGGAGAAAPKPAAPAPSGTSDILASIKSGGAAKPASGGTAPKGTADILASIKGGGAAKPASGGTAAPKGTADIMASIKGGGAAKPAAAATGKPAAAAKAAVDTAAAFGMSAAEMIKAARQGIGISDKSTGSSSPPKAKALALPKKPLKKSAPPKAGGKAGGKGVPRRGFLETCVATICSPIFIAWSSLVASTAVSSLAMARFMMPNVLVEPPTKFKIGPPTDYGGGTVSTKWKAQFGVWIVNDDLDGQQMIYALSTVCTHLGCTPNWLEGEQKFKCPCHGSGFYKSGVNFEGPAPRPLERHGIRLAEDGMLEVDKSVKFQRELGQWEIAASFVPV